MADLNHLELMKKLLLALEEETHDYSPVPYLHMLGRLTDEEYAELKKLEVEAMEASHG